jgi:hypothetical protein
MTREDSSNMISPMISGIDRTIKLLDEQAKMLRVQIPEGVITHSRSQSNGDDIASQLEELDLFIARLQQVKQVLQQDPRLLPLIDEYIGQQVKAMEKRQSAYNIRLTIIATLAGAILGWLVSALASPIVLWHMFIH